MEEENVQFCSVPLILLYAEAYDPGERKRAAGKAAFKANYWRCVLVAFILTLIAGVVGGVSGLTSSTTAMMGSLGAFSGDQFMNVTVDEDGVDKTT